MDYTATITKVSANNGLLNVVADFVSSKGGAQETAVLTYTHWLNAPEIEKPQSAPDDFNKAAWSLDGAIRKLWREKNPTASENLKVEKPDDYPPGFFRLALGNSLSDGEAEAVYQVPPKLKSRREQEIKRYLTPFNTYCPIPDPKRPVETVTLRRFTHFDDRDGEGWPIVDPVRLLSIKKDQLANEAVWQGVRSFSIQNLSGHRTEIDFSKDYPEHILIAPEGYSPAEKIKSEETPISQEPPQAKTRPRTIVVPDPPPRPPIVDGKYVNGFHHGRT